MKFLLLFIMLVNSAFACPVEDHEFLFSGMKSFSEGPNESGLTKEDFEEVFTRLKNHYEPEFTSRGLEMQYTMDWSNTWFNAQTGWAGPKTVKFFFSGEAARGKYMTKDGLMFIGCHEMGHHFGNPPK